MIWGKNIIAVYLISLNKIMIAVVFKKIISRYAVLVCELHNLAKNLC